MDKHDLAPKENEENYRVEIVLSDSHKLAERALLFVIHFIVGV